MKKFIVALLIVCGLLAAGAAFAIADIGQPWMQKVGSAGGYVTDDTSDTAFAAQIGGYIRIALSFVGSIFFVLTLYAGFLWMTAAGEDDKIKKAKDILKSAIIGLAITLGAYSITAFVVPRVMSQSQGGTTIPTSQ
jgi:hypothetical protein